MLLEILCIFYVCISQLNYILATNTMNEFDQIVLLLLSLIYFMSLAA